MTRHATHLDAEARFSGGFVWWSRAIDPTTISVNNPGAGTSQIFPAGRIPAC